MAQGPLSGIRVLDLTQYIAGPYCTKLFADAGAEVIKVEKPERGDGARWLAPFAGGEPHPEKSVTFLYLNTNKKSVVLDLKTDEGVQKLKQLVLDADILVESFRPGTMARLGLDYQTLERLNPKLVMTSISNFGQDGPYRDYEATEVVLSALSGMMYATGTSDREPLKLALSQVQYTAGVAAAIGTLAAYRQRKLSGCGQQVDIAVLEPMLSTIYQATGRYTYAGIVLQRSRPGGFPVFAQTKDGWLNLPSGWLNELLSFLKLPELEDPKFQDKTQVRQHFPEMIRAIKRGLAESSKHDIFHRAQAAGVPVAPVQEEKDLLQCPQLAARDYFVEIEHPVAGKAKYPDRDFYSQQIEKIEARPAPLLGQHTAEVLAQLAEPRERPAFAPVSRRAGARPLEGVRVLCPQFWATVPVGTRHLAGLGAEVIAYESPMHPHADPKTRITEQNLGFFNDITRGKSFISLDFSTPLGQEIFKRLVKECDVVAHNYAPRVMREHGLDYEALCAVNPGVIDVAMSGFGHQGPWQSYRGYALTGEAASGLVHLTGYEGGHPDRPGATPYGDMIPSFHVAWAILVALEHRERTGRGALIDMAMTEPSTGQLGEALVNYAYNGQSIGRLGNRDLNAAPSGCYRCAGEDKWIAIATRTEKQWQALVGALGNPAWAQEERFRTLEGRLAHQDELDANIGEWTASRDNKETMKRLQAAGVPAAAVLNMREVLTDEHLRARGAYEVIQLPPPPEGPGNRLHVAPPWKLSKTPASTSRPGPFRFAQENDLIYRGLLKMTDEEIAAAEEAGVIASEAKVAPERKAIPDAPQKRDEGYLRVLGLRP